jgi:hypothetical protein
MDLEDEDVEYHDLVVDDTHKLKEETLEEPDVNEPDLMDEVQVKQEEGIVEIQQQEEEIEAGAQFDDDERSMEEPKIRSQRITRSKTRKARSKSLSKLRTRSQSPVARRTRTQRKRIMLNT